jgi:predicted branched-subunit amino acid permease
MVDRRAFLGGMRAGAKSVFLWLLLGTYLGLGALAHDLGFSLTWTLVATVLIWAGPTQLIITSMLGTSATMVEIAIAVTLSAVRLLPMVVSLLPLLRTPQTRFRQLILPAHLTAVSLWVEGQRLLPDIAPANRVAFVNGFGAALTITAVVAVLSGYFMARELPTALASALLFLTPLSFMMSLARNSRHLADKLALVLGLLIAPVMAFYRVELDILWSGLLAGTLAFFAWRMRRSRA